MSAGTRKTWLVAYDIRCPRRLRRAHRLLRREGATLQYSAFALECNDTQLRDVLRRLEAVIDTQADDVRAYHVPERCAVWTLGVQNLPAGIVVDATLASVWLQQRQAPSARTST